jgi:formylglycine-generating enzyme required for sulfatase activity
VDELERWIRTPNSAFVLPEPLTGAPPAHRKMSVRTAARPDALRWTNELCRLHFGKLRGWHISDISFHSATRSRASVHRPLSTPLLSDIMCRISLVLHRRRVIHTISSASGTRGRVPGRLFAICLAGVDLFGSAALAESSVRLAPWQMAVETTGLAAQQDKLFAATPGFEFKDCPNGCPAMIVIPGGKFMMGSPGDEPDRYANEGPLHEVTIARFAVSKFEVTFDEWDACVSAAACARVPDSWGRGAMPVINVSWRDAKQYVGWLSQLTGKEYRLLTEAEWEYAARAGANTPYSWGKDPATGDANCDGCGSPWDRKQTAPVGSFKPNAFGLFDVHGNVWEWVEDSWHDTYGGAPSDGSARLESADPSLRVARGGSWRNEREFVRAAVRVKRHINVRFDTLGFRVARTLEP